MRVNLHPLVTASSLPLLWYLFPAQGIQGVKRLLLKNCNEIRSIVKLYIDYINFLRNVKNRIIVTPSIGIAPYIAIQQHSYILPTSILLFVKRLMYSNPFSFKLFLEDVDICMENLRKQFSGTELGKLKYSVLFIYDPILFSETMVHSIPMVILFDSSEIDSNIMVDNETSVLSIKFEQFTVLRNNNDGYSIIMPTFKEIEKMDGSFKEESLINDFYISVTCNPLLCLDSMNTVNSVLEFNTWESLFKYLLHEWEGSTLYIELWSSYAIVKEYPNRRYRYLWIPYLNKDNIKWILKFLLSTIQHSFSEVDKVTIISPFKIFSELGSISMSRIWLSNVIEQILAKNNKVRIEFII